MKIFLEILLIVFAAVNLLLAYQALFRLHQPTTVFPWLIKVMASGSSPILFLVGIEITLFALLLNSMIATTIGSLSVLLFLIHILTTITKPKSHTGFDSAFGQDWSKKIPVQTKKSFLSKRYVYLLPNCQSPIFSQNISFYNIPATDRNLLCDIWQPPINIPKSGVAFIYLHGSAWTSLDKDFGTRPFFKHLANEGHVIMDVAYRLFPETDMMGMVHDAKHAVAWMKNNADVYGIDPNRIVIGGGSAGAHIALLAAYTNFNDQFTPGDLQTSDLSVHGVISLYGQCDLVATYYHTGQHLARHSALSQQKTAERGGMPKWIQKKLGIDFKRLGFDKNVDPGFLAPMFGGTPDEKPAPYALFSPIAHVDHICPATLIIHGDQDILAPLTAIRRLYSSLKKARVPVVMHILPQTDHAFDLIFPKISPSAQNAYYDVERFLGIMAYMHAKRVKVLREVGQI